MTTNTHHTSASVDAVWAVLADPWSYASWVVGASRIRTVEGEWPKVDAKIHHSVGAWPILLNDETSVADCEPGRRLVLRAAARPFGVAQVELELQPDPAGCLITMREAPVSGPATMLPAAVQEPALKRRNSESLLRLALIAEGRDPNAQTPSP
ncbi:SRPBCC family protein [Pedococcus sp. 5OH_020]|uniref:SRPBCC family protein n=1 Tax=Pedococcus sp. 5OH_020 TaxID=2989814 RepID=UPI0022E9D795|nr:SRPBCC family protein [Pedococcus sp. 5OH_020]